jgi:hypothetical protein
MNIFFLHERPEIAAQMLCDKHVVKMLLECCQMLWAAWHLTGFDNWSETVPTTIKVYKLTHAKHPTCMWVRRRPENYRWTAVHAQAIDREYTRRYGKVHACSKMAEWFAVNAPLCNDCNSFPPAKLLVSNDTNCKGRLAPT